jgi:hypothetical protein
MMPRVLLVLVLAALGVQALDVWRLGAERGNTTLTVALVCGWHAREWATVELCAHWESLVHSQPGPFRWLIVPSMNSNTQRVKQGHVSACRRTNSRGVDPNRNWPRVCQPVGFSEPVQGDEDYAGAEPLSETEVRELDQLLREERPHVLLTAHTGANAIMTPYDTDCREQQSISGTMTKFANWLADGFSMREGMRPLVGPGHQLLGYSGHGTLGDYAAHTLRVPIVLTLETWREHAQCPQRSEDDVCMQQFVPHLRPEQGCKVDLQAWLQRWGSVVRSLRDIKADDLRTLRGWVQ